MQNSNKALVDHLQEFLDYCEIEKGLSHKTSENYSKFLVKFFLWLFSETNSCILPHQLTVANVYDYKIFIKSHKNPATGKALETTTKNCYLVSLRCFLNYLADKDIKSLPSSKIKLLKSADTKNKIKFLSPYQAGKLLEQVDISIITGLRDRAILETFFSTGLRVSELVSLNKNQFDFKDIDKLKKAGSSYELSVMGKGGRTRPVYFSFISFNFLKKYLDSRNDSEKALFINYRSCNPKDLHKRLTVRSVARVVEKYSKKAGLPIVASPHTLRHSFATDLLFQGVGLRDVQEFLGHKNISTTQIYTHVTNKKLHDIHDKIHGGKR